MDDKMPGSDIKNFSRKIFPFILALSMIATSACGCNKNPVKDYLTELGLQPAAAQQVESLGYDELMDTNDKALIDEIYFLPQSLQINEDVLNSLKSIAEDEKVTDEELAGFQDLDQDKLSNRQELNNGAGVLTYKTNPLKPNPNIKYALDKGLSAYIEQIKPMDEDGKQSEDEKSTLELAHKILQSEISEAAKEGNIIYVLSGRAASFEKVYNQLAVVSEAALNEIIEFGLDDNIVKYLTAVSSLTDKDFAKYALENKLCIQDRNPTDLEIKFLNEPDKYSTDLLDYNLSEINKISPELAMELKQLPDFKQVDIKDVEALEDIVALAPYKLVGGISFESMFEEGIKDKRKYCTPLEALVWILYDFDKDYLDTKPWEVTLHRNDNLPVPNPLRLAVQYTWQNSSESNNYQSDRWEDFDEAVDRLNSPDLVSVYTEDNIRYESEEVNEYAPAWTIFERKYDDCDGFATIQAYFLKANGYDAWNIGIAIDTLIGHNVCGYKDNEQWRILDVSGRMRGPFESLDGVGSLYKIPKGSSIHLIDPFTITSLMLFPHNM